MAKRLFVGNLPFKLTDQELKSFFETVGQVSSAIIVTDKFSGRSRGFGFVEMENDAEANEAIAKLNGSELLGRQIVVNEARPMRERRALKFRSKKQ